MTSHHDCCAACKQTIAELTHALQHCIHAVEPAKRLLARLQGQPDGEPPESEFEFLDDI